MFPRAQIKEYAKMQFQAYYGTMLAVYVIYALIINVAYLISGGLALIIIQPPLLVGMGFFSYLVYQGERPDVGQMFSFGFDDFGRKLGGVLWTWLFAFLWSLLFVVPGIIKSFAYSMTPYLLAEYPNIPPTEVIKVSMKITDGRKWDIFVVYLSFIGWGLLAIVTFGLSQLFYSGPYMEATFAGVYDVLKKDALETGRITLAELGVYPSQAQGDPNFQNNPNSNPQNGGYYGNPENQQNPGNPENSNPQNPQNPENPQ